MRSSRKDRRLSFNVNYPEYLRRLKLNGGSFNPASRSDAPSTRQSHKPSWTMSSANYIVDCRARWEWASMIATSSDHISCIEEGIYHIWIRTGPDSFIHHMHSNSWSDKSLCSMKGLISFLYYMYQDFLFVDIYSTLPDRGY